MAKLINGNGNPAIYAGEDADLIASLAGNVTCIANVGNKYAATEEDANTIGLADGVIITKEGRRIQLDAGGTDLFTIPTGSSGVTNYYIIGYKLVQNDDSTQVAEKFVQKMSSSSETITENTFRGGATEVYVSLYRVTQVGFDITAVDGLLSAFLDNAAIEDDIAQINSDLSDKINTSDIINNLTSTATNKPLSANQGKVLDKKISDLPVKANDTHFYNNNGLSVTNTAASNYTDVNCRNVLVSGGYVKNDNGITIVNNSGNTFKPVNASDFSIDGSKSLKTFYDNVNPLVKPFSCNANENINIPCGAYSALYLAGFINGLGARLGTIRLSGGAVYESTGLSDFTIQYNTTYNVLVLTPSNHSSAIINAFGYDLR